MVARSFPEGVGINAMPEFHDEIMAHDGELFSFIELDPEEYLLERPIVRELLRAHGERYPVVLHSTTLSLCGDNDLSETLLSQVEQVAALTGASLYSDHLSLSWAGDILLDLYMAPVMEESAIEWLQSRVGAVRNRVGLPFAVENVGMLVSPVHSSYSEVEFLRRALDGADCGLQLNLDSVAISADTLRTDPLEYLSTFPWDRVVTITLVPEICMNPVLRIRYGSSLDGLMARMLEMALRRSPARKVVIQRRDGNSLASLRSHFELANDLYRRFRS